VCVDGSLKDVCGALVEREVKRVFRGDEIESGLGKISFLWSSTGYIETRITPQLPAEPQLHQRQTFLKTLG
jgi:hypothetical protein